MKYFVLLSIFIVLNFLSFGQKIKFDHGTAYPDTNICHLNKAAHFIFGFTDSAYNGLSYSIVADFGDGTFQTLTGTYSVVQNYKHDLSHTYTTSGNKAIKYTLLNNLNNAVDSIVRVFDVGNCSVSAGFVYFDCVQDCAKEDAEMTLPSRFFPFNRNGQGRRYWLDSTGAYNIPVFAGDTITKHVGVVDWTYSFIGNCTPSTIVANNTHQNVAVWLYNNVSMLDTVYGKEKLCFNNFFLSHWSIDIFSGNGNKWGVRREYGNGGMDGSYMYQAGYSLGLSIAIPPYFTPGNYVMTCFLYASNMANNSTGTYGPVMRAKKRVHLATCTPVNVTTYYDQNNNCLKDMGEEPVDLSANPVFTSNIIGFTNPNTGSNLPAGLATVDVYPGDTLIPPTTAITVFNRTFGSYYVNSSLDSSCNFYITTTPNQYNIAYKPTVDIYAIDYTFPPPCIGDSFFVDLFTANKGFLNNTVGKIYANYGDGTIDSQNVAFAMDSIDIRISHVYQTPGNYNTMFILKSGAISDTISFPVSVDNCWVSNLRVFDDQNKNCILDNNEVYVLDYSAKTNSGTYFSDPNSGVVKCKFLFPIDSLLEVNHSGVYYYDRWNAKLTCNWPVVSASGQFFDVPLDDNDVYQGNVNQSSPFNVKCDTVRVYNTFGLNGYENGFIGNRLYQLNLYTGDGTVYSRNVNPAYISVFAFSETILPSFSYPSGSYIAGMKLFDIASGGLLYQFQNPTALKVLDTCAAITGRLFFDINNNCLEDNGESGLSNAGIQVLQNGLSTTYFTDLTGNYRITADTGDAVNISFPASFKGSSVTCLSPVVNTTFQGPLLVDIPYSCSSPTNDLSVSMSHGQWLTGGSDSLLLYIGGNACNAQQGTLTLQLDPALTYLGSSLSNGQQSGQQISWTINDLSLLPNAIKVFIAISSSALPSQSMCVDASIQSAFTDPNPNNNLFTICDSIVPVFQPLFKNASSGNKINNVQNGSPIVYGIFFTNTTNNVVNQVTILDTISTLLDVNSIQLLNASHSYQATVLNNNVLKITLSNTALASGHSGKIAYSVLPIATLPFNTPIYNTATIIFGFDTIGTSNNSIVQKQYSSTINRSNKDVVFKVYPNPASQELFVDIRGIVSTEKIQFEVIDVLGRTRIKSVLHEGANRIQTSQFERGVYFIKITQNDLLLMEKILLN